MLKRHAGASGIRVNVLKPDLKTRTEGNRKSDWTAVYVRGRDLAHMLAMTDGNVEAVTAAVRLGSMTAYKHKARSFSAACVAAARKHLERVRAEAETSAAKFADDNNNAWSQAT